MESRVQRFVKATWHMGCIRSPSLAEYGLPKRQGNDMLNAAIALFIIALVAAFLGFGGIAGASAGLAKVAFFVFLVLAVLAFMRRAT